MLAAEPSVELRSHISYSLTPLATYILPLPSTHSYRTRHHRHCVKVWAATFVISQPRAICQRLHECSEYAKTFKYLHLVDCGHIGLAKPLDRREYEQ